MDVVLRPYVLGHDGVEVPGVIGGWLGLFAIVAPEGRSHAQAGDHLACDGDCVRIVEREMVRDARDAGVNVRAAELLGRDVYSGRRLHQRRPTDEDRALAFDDDRLIAHRGNVRASRRARAHDQSELWDRGRGKARLVVEDAPEMLPVGEDLILPGQERAARIDKVEAGQPVLERYLLRAQVLFHGQRVVRPALDGRVVCDDHAQLPGDATDPGDDPGSRRFVVVHAEGGEWRELEEGRAGIQ